MRASWNSTWLKRSVAAASFAAFFEDREHHPAEADTKIDIQPQALTKSEKGKKPPELFISYAWGDDTSEGKIRAEVVDALYATLEKDGFQPVRDRNAMRPGDSISAFIRRLTRADLVVAVISDKYLRSPYCMHEIYRLWQKSQTAAEDMIERLVPIMLPEVKIGNVRERMPYLRYWADQAKSLEELVRDPDLRPSSESWEEVRLVREFAHHVDGIRVFLQDVLMPRKLEVHFEDGFQGGAGCGAAAGGGGDPGRCSGLKDKHSSKHPMGHRRTPSAFSGRYGYNQVEWRARPCTLINCK